VHYQIKEGEIYNYMLRNNHITIVATNNQNMTVFQNNQKVILQGYSICDNVQIIQIGDETLIVFVQHDCFNIIDLNGKHKMSFNYFNCDISCDGTQVIYRRDNVLYKACISDFYFNSKKIDIVWYNEWVCWTFNKFDAKVQIDYCKFLFWIRGSNRLVILGYYCENSIDLEYTIVNIETSAKFKFTWTLSQKFFDTRDYFIEQLPESINFYNVTSLTFVKSVEFKIQFVAFHKLLNVFVTNEFDCYYIRSDMELKKITLGQNYLRDRSVYCNQFMDFLLNDYLLLSLLSDEILHVELYTQLLDSIQIFW